MKQPTARQMKYWNARLRTFRLGEHRARNTNILSYVGSLRDTRRVMTSITLTDDHDIAAMMVNDEFDDLT